MSHQHNGAPPYQSPLSPAELAHLLRRDLWMPLDAARLFSVSPRTLSKWCDSGRLACYRLPGSGDRRFKTADLAEFCLREGLEQHLDLIHPATLGTCGLPAGWQTPLALALPGWTVHSCPTLYHLGRVAYPRALVLGQDLPRWQRLELVRLLAVEEHHPTLLAILTEEDSTEGEWMLAGLAGFLRMPLPAEQGALALAKLVSPGDSRAEGDLT